MTKVKRFPVKAIRHRVRGGPYQQMRETIRLIGTAIKNGSRYLPIRNYAAGLATTANPKDYLGQVRAIYDDIIKRWRYVKDPLDREMLTFDPHALAQLVLGLDGVGVGKGKGAGDCDCIASAAGAALRSIGFPVRIGVTASPGSPAGRMFGHVFVQTQIPGMGWITFDPVLHPKRQFGAVPAHSRIAFFNLDGRVIGQRGNVIGLNGADENEGVKEMYGRIAPLSHWQDMGFGGADGVEPEDWRAYGPSDFGELAEQQGIYPCDNIGLAAEAELELMELPNGKFTVGSRTPILEVVPKDLRYVKKHGRPYDGMGAVSDTGSIYAYDGSLGFFTKIFSAAKSAVSKVGSGIKSIVKRIPGGKYLIKLGSKLYKLSKKFVRPLIKYVGKYATKLAPVAALIPGYGPAIAAGLYTAGKVAQLMEKYGVVLKGAKGALRKLKFKSGKKAKKFKKAMKKAAAKEKRKAEKMGRGKYRQHVKGKIKGKMAGDDDYVNEEYEMFLGAVAPAKRIRRMLRRGRRMARGLPVKRGPMIFPGRRREMFARSRVPMGPYAHLFPGVPKGPLRRAMLKVYLKKNPSARRR